MTFSPSFHGKQKKVEAVTDFLFLGSKITVDGDFSQEIRISLLLGKKSITNLDRVLKGKDIILPATVHIVKATFFPVVIYSSESWTIKKAECQRADAFELWCCKRLLRFPWTWRRTNQLILWEINHEYLLKELMLKLKLQYFGPLDEEPSHWKKPWCWEILKAKEEWGSRGWDS